MSEEKELIITCRHCGFAFWTGKEEEIRNLQELYDAHVLQCPICEKRDFTFSMKGKRIKEVENEA